MPHSKDCVAVSVSFLPSRRLHSTLRKTYAFFQETHPNIAVGFSTFCKHLPDDVQRTTYEHKVCVCVIGQNLKCMLEPLTIESTVELLLGTCGNDGEDCSTGHCNRCHYNAIEASLRAETEDYSTAKFRFGGATP